MPVTPPSHARRAGKRPSEVVTPDDRTTRLMRPIPKRPRLAIAGTSNSLHQDFHEDPRYVKPEPDDVVMEDLEPRLRQLPVFPAPRPRALPNLNDAVQRLRGALDRGRQQHRRDDGPEYSRHNLPNGGSVLVHPANAEVRVKKENGSIDITFNAPGPRGWGGNSSTVDRTIFGGSSPARPSADHGAGPSRARRPLNNPFYDLPLLVKREPSSEEDMEDDDEAEPDRSPFRRSSVARALLAVKKEENEDEDDGATQSMKEEQDSEEEEIAFFSARSPGAFMSPSTSSRLRQSMMSSPSSNAGPSNLNSAWSRQGPATAGPSTFSDRRVRVPQRSGRTDDVFSPSSSARGGHGTIDYSSDGYSLGDAFSEPEVDSDNDDDDGEVRAERSGKEAQTARDRRYVFKGRKYGGDED